MSGAASAVAGGTRRSRASDDKTATKVYGNSGRELSKAVAAFTLDSHEAINRSRLRRLMPVLETLAGRIAGTVSANTRQPVHVRLADTPQRTWESFAGDLSGSMLVSAATVTPFEYRPTLYLPGVLVQTVLDFQLGGDGRPEEPPRPLTEVERELFGPVLADIWNALPVALAPFMEASVGAPQNVANGLLVQPGRPLEPCLFAEFDFAIAEGAHLTPSLCFPQSVIIAIADASERQGDEGLVRRDLRDTERRLRQVEVEVKASLPQKLMTRAELMALKVGDVIPWSDRSEIPPVDLNIDEVRIGTGVIAAQGDQFYCTVDPLYARRKDQEESNG